MAQYRLGSMLIQKGLISADQLAEALTYQQTHKGMPVGEALKTLGHITEKDIKRALRRQNRIRFCGAVVAFLMAPFHWAQADDDLEHLPEYQYTQVHDQMYYDADETSYGGNLGSASLDLIQVTSAVLWYAYKGDVNTDQLEDIPVKMNIAVENTRSFKVQFSVQF